VRDECESVGPAEGDGYGGRDYDALDGAEQARVRATWDERMTRLRAELDLARDFTVAGRTYVELDTTGTVVTRRPQHDDHTRI
jgi:hypothetical protein